MINDTRNTSATPLTDDEKAVLDYFKHHPHATKKDLAAVLGKSAATAARIVRRLVEKGALKHVGPNKGGQWTVLSF